MKSVFDRLSAALGLLVLAPLLALIALVLRLAQGSPVLFRQSRPGLGGKPFVLVKFRTMAEGRDAHDNPLPDRQRLTRIGRFLRATSLDELPELWNVLKGEMSLVGPRPLLMEYLDRYTPEQARRHEAKPGITGWAQVNGRNEISWEERFRMDVWYVDHRSFWLDLKILALTVIRVLSRKGVSAPGHDTMGVFQPARKSDAGGAP